MSGATLVAKKQKDKSNLTKSHATFYRHRNKIEKLRFQHTELKDKLEEALNLYHGELKSLMKKGADKVTEFVMLITSLQQKISFQKEDQETLNEILQNSVRTIFSMVSPNHIHEEIKKLYKEMNGYSLEENFQEQMSKLQEFLKDETGIGFDLSDIDSHDSEQDILRKLAEKVSSAQKENDDESLPKPKTKKETLKEAKLLELEEIQNKNLNNLYKKLAKEIHPDLEQNSEIRKQKEEQMKLLTTAYEEGDLLTLLKIESECLEGNESSVENLSDETIKIYNSLLKDQINFLEIELDILSMHPRYIEIVKYIEEFPRKPVKGVLQAIEECNEIISEYSTRISDISGDNVKNTLKAIFKEFREQKEIDLLRESFWELLEYDDF